MIGTAWVARTNSSEHAYTSSSMIACRGWARLQAMRVRSPRCARRLPPMARASSAADLARGWRLTRQIARHKKARLQRTASGLCSLPHVGMQDHSARPESDLHAALQNNTRQYRTGAFSSPQRVRCRRQRNRSGCARYHSGARSRCHSGVSPRKPTAALSIPQRASRLPLRRLPCRRRRAST